MIFFLVIYLQYLYYFVGKKPSTIRVGGTPTNWSVVHQTWKTLNIDQDEKLSTWRKTWTDLGLLLTLADDTICREDVSRLSLLLNHSSYLEVYDLLPTKVTKSDFWRYTKLYLDGGFYTDIDVVGKPGLLDLFREHSYAQLLLFYENEDDALTRLKKRWGPPCSTFARIPQIRNSIIGSAPRHDALKNTLDNIVEVFRSKSYKRYETDLRQTLELTGPAVFTDSVQLWIDHPSTTVLSRGETSVLFDHKAMGTWKQGSGTCWPLVYSSTCLVIFGGIILFLVFLLSQKYLFRSNPEIHHV